MPAGQLHYRVGGRAFVREPGDRRLFAEVLALGQAGQVVPGRSGVVYPRS